MELYFWAFVVAIIIFGLGAGVSIYEGLHKVAAPEPVSNPVVNYVVLGLAMAFELVAWTIAFREFRAIKGSLGFVEAVRQSKDPTLFTVLFEDSAAMLGLIVALVGIAAGQWLGMPMLDGVASLVIGAILAMTAIVLAYECKGLLIGEGASRSVVDGIEAIVAAEPGILEINEALTMHFGPNEVLLTLSVDFGDDLSATEVEAVIADLERRIKSAYPIISRVFIEAQSIRAHQQSRQAVAVAAHD
jgi:divalent metal cation (Fe/Co/Zn/Cd) transporter